MRETLLTATCTLRAPLAEVAALLIAVEAGPVGPTNAWLVDRGVGATLAGGPTLFDYASPEGTSTLEVEPGRSIRYTGGWWYRATYTLFEDGPWTRVELRVDNAAAQPAWIVRSFNPGWRDVLQNGEQQFERRMRDAARRLDCEVDFA